MPRKQNSYKLLRVEGVESRRSLRTLTDKDDTMKAEASRLPIQKSWAQVVGAFRRR